MIVAPEPNPICEAEGHDWMRAILRERGLPRRDRTPPQVCARCKALREPESPADEVPA